MTIITQNHIAEGTALAISLIAWRFIKKSKLRSLPSFLAFILLVELAGSYLSRIKRIDNWWLYNLSIPIEYGYYLFLFRLHGKRLLKKIVPYILLVFAGISIYYFIAQPIKQAHPYVLLAGQISVVIATCIYIYELFDDPGEFPLWQDYFFWLASGLFLFNLGESIYFGLYPLIREYEWTTFSFWFKTINNNLLLLLYLSYDISILILLKYSSRKSE